MKIEGLPPESGGIRKISEKKLPQPAANETPKETDSIAISGNATLERAADLVRLVPSEFPVRSNEIAAATERLAQDRYSTPEVQEQTAKRLIESLDVTIPHETMPNEHPESVERRERLQTVQTRSASGYYDRPETLAAVAEKLAESLGLASLYGN